jgi:hypothetical protein
MYARTTLNLRPAVADVDGGGQISDSGASFTAVLRSVILDDDGSGNDATCRCT